MMGWASRAPADGPCVAGRSFTESNRAVSERLSSALELQRGAEVLLLCCTGAALALIQPANPLARSTYLSHHHECDF